MGNPDLRKLPNNRVKPLAARVSLTNTNKANGAIGAIATPLESDSAQWLAIGWTRTLPETTETLTQKDDTHE